MPEQIPVTFLCAVSVPLFGERQALILDMPRNGFVERQSIRSGYDVYSLLSRFSEKDYEFHPDRETLIPDRAGLYRYDGTAIRDRDDEQFGDYWKHDGKFTPIMIPRADWFEQEVA